MSEDNVKWFYNAGSDRKGPFNEEQISALLSADAINAHTKVWSEIINEWTPLFRTDLRKLLGDKPITPPDIIPELQTEHRAEAATAHTVAPSHVQPAAQPASARLYDNKVLGNFLSWCLMACAIIDGYIVFRLIKAENRQAQYNSLLFLEDGRVQFFLAIPILITMALFLTWKYRATANAFNLRGTQSVTPAGAVYWYFVPIYWFWKPYEAMKNLHGAFIGDGKYTDVKTWWGVWWGGIGIGLAAALFLPASAAETNTYSFGAYYFWSIVIVAIEGVQLMAARHIVKTLNAAETEKLTQTADRSYSEASL